VLLIASATARFIGVAILWVPIANAPAGFVQHGLILIFRDSPIARPDIGFAG
jgi:hypothetical protein